MQTVTYFLIFLAAGVALLFAFFQYYNKSGRTFRYRWLLIALKFISLFSLLLLLVNPKISTTTYSVEKPNLVVAVDNSASMGHLGSTAEVSEFLAGIKENPEIGERFELQVYSFGKDLELKDSLNFDGKQTNISGALKSLDKLYQSTTSPTILITDGNHNFGADYGSLGRGYSNKIFPVLVGDTTTYKDVSLGALNVNRYTFLGNNFPVEAIVNYEGEETVQAKLEINSEGKLLFSETVHLDEENNSQIVSTHLSASTVGTTIYRAGIVPLEGEKNTLNNVEEFMVEVVDERISVLIVRDKVHPDLGALKRSLESNQQREVTFQSIKEPMVDLQDYELVIVYQPNRDFESLLKQLDAESRGYWLITGAETDWEMLNELQPYFEKEITSATEEYFPEMNPDYLPFQLQNIGFSDFPPLRDSFGRIQESGLNTILFQQVQGVRTEEPLLATVEEENRRYAFLFGAGIWKWRSHMFTESESHRSFDDFIGKITQYLASDIEKERLSVGYEAFYSETDEIIITARVFDKNYHFDPREELTLEIVDTATGEIRTIPFVLTQSSGFEANLGYLPASEYSFTVSVLGGGQTEKGSFTVRESTIEQKLQRSNLEGLQALAKDKGSSLYFLKDSQKLVSDLLSDNNSVPVQKSRQNVVPLVDWYFLLAFIIVALSAEWFLRKYQGLV